MKLCTVIRNFMGLDTLLFCRENSKAVSAYLTRKQILPFGFARQYTAHFRRPFINARVLRLLPSGAADDKTLTTQGAGLFTYVTTKRGRYHKTTFVGTDWNRCGWQLATMKLNVRRNSKSMMDTSIFHALEEEDLLLIAAVLHRKKIRPQTRTK